MARLRDLDLWGALVIILFTIVLSALVIVDRSSFSFSVGSDLFTHWAAWIGGFWIAVVTPIYCCPETSSSHENQSMGKNTHVWKFGCLHAYFCSFLVLGNICFFHGNGICIICCHAYARSDRSFLKVQHNAKFKKVHQILTHQHDHSILSHLGNSYFKPHDSSISRV